MVYQCRGVGVVGVSALKGIGARDNGGMDSLCAHRHRFARSASIEHGPERADRVVEAVGYRNIDKHVLADRKYVLCERCAYLLGCKSEGIPTAVNDGILRIYGLRREAIYLVHIIEATLTRYCYKLIRGYKVIMSLLIRERGISDGKATLKVQSQAIVRAVVGNIELRRVIYVDCEVLFSDCLIALYDLLTLKCHVVGQHDHVDGGLIGLLVGDKLAGVKEDIVAARGDHIYVARDLCLGIVVEIVVIQSLNIVLHSADSRNERESVCKPYHLAVIVKHLQKKRGKFGVRCENVRLGCVGVFIFYNIVVNSIAYVGRDEDLVALLEVGRKHICSTQIVVSVSKMDLLSERVKVVNARVVRIEGVERDNELLAAARLRSRCFARSYGELGTRAHICKDSRVDKSERVIVIVGLVLRTEGHGKASLLGL